VKDSYLIGLTGNLGSGKSTVRKMLEQLGARGIDADALAHTVMERGSSTWRTIVEAFDTDILTFNGHIDRQKLGERVFADAEGLKKLEAIVHPAVGAHIKQIVREDQAPVIVIEAIKLLEANLGQWCDSVWVVQCTPQVQIQRVMQDRNMSEADARARLASQSPAEDKVKYAHVVIDNNHDEDTTRAQVEKTWSAIRSETARDKSAWLYDLPPKQTISQPAAPPVPKPAAKQELGVKPPTPVWAKSKPPAHSAEPGIEQKTLDPSFPPVPTWANVEADVEIRRARRSDLNALSIAFAKQENRQRPLTREETLRRFGERGYFIAVTENRIAALAAWEAENLVAIVRELWEESADAAPVVLPKLFAMIEQEAGNLVCEVVLLQIKESALTLAAEALAAGYHQYELRALHPQWQSVARERLRPSDQIWLKRLREGITTKPI
jgi:dephospho-CoA kinase